MANSVVVHDTDEVLLVGFADEQDGAYREALHFQRSYEFDDQDISLGMDEVYVERGLQSGAAYGGILAVRLSPEQVRVSVDARTAAALGDNEFEVGLSVPTEEIRALREALQRVFKGFLEIEDLPG